MSESDAVPAVDRAGAALRRLIDAVLVDGVPGDLLAAVADGADVLTDRLLGAAPTEAHAGLGRYLETSSLVGSLNPLAPPAVVRGHDGSGTALLTVRFGRAYEGNPGEVHGAWVAAMFDEVLAAAVSSRPLRLVTGTLTVRFRRPTPLGVELRFDGTAGHAEGRKVHVSGRCVADGGVTADADAIFLAPRPSVLDDPRVGS